MNQQALFLSVLYAIWWSIPVSLCADEVQLLDDFTETSQWIAAPADGVEMSLANDEGSRGKGLRIDFDFRDHAGWVSAVRPLKMELSENFVFEFDIRGRAPSNHLEVKFIDETGDNVWWMPYRDFQFSDDWRRLRIKRRHIERAWGPDPDRTLEKISAIEITVAAGEGGQGALWIDELSFEPLEPERPYDLTPHITCSSNSPGSEPEAILVKQGTQRWQALPTDLKPWVEIDFLKSREFGGLVLTWNHECFASDYRVLSSDDGKTWVPLYTVRNGNGKQDYIPLPEREARHLKIEVQESSGTGGVALNHLEVAPLEFGASSNNLFQRIAKDSPTGFYPKYFTDEQSYWTVVGVDGAREEALINEQGMVELGKGLFSLEPFLQIENQLVTWNDMHCEPSLAGGYLPIPSVTWESQPVELRITALAQGTMSHSKLYTQYLLTNRSPESKKVNLFVALRPFQVNPPWQFLGVRGGVSLIKQIELKDSLFIVNEEIAVGFDPPPGSHYFTTFDEGGAFAAIQEGTGRGRDEIRKEGEFTAGVLEFPFDIPAGAQRQVCVVTPLNENRMALSATDISIDFEELHNLVAAEWRGKLEGFQLSLPPDCHEIADTLKSNLAYILINRDGPGIQPGSRSYERSWIRDGALTSSALLRMGKFDAVRDFLAWYAPFQFENGKVPCSVDHRGADSVPEHDSHGQLIYAIAEYHRYTGDHELLQELWPYVVKAVDYIQQLRSQRMTEEYKIGKKLAFYGLVPESISHEGYSAEPMHSYWDDLFVLRGLKDAVYVAEQVEESEVAAEYEALCNEFRSNLLASLSLAMKQHQIDYLPGCVELGDFDATSTTVVVSPGAEYDAMPQKELKNTFDKYWAEFIARREGTKEWEAYTPYEWRVVGTLIRLGHKDLAHEAIDYFFTHRRPAEWNHWAEVVFADRDEPGFIGDMPHTWIGSDFIRSLLDIFAYDRESDESLIIGAGIPEKWLIGTEGVSVNGLHSRVGELNLHWSHEARTLRVRIDGEIQMPKGGFHVFWPLSEKCLGVSINGEASQLVDGSHVVVRKVPAYVEFQY